MAKNVGPRNTKAEILEALNELKKEKDELHSKLKKSEKEKTAKNMNAPQNNPIVQVKTLENKSEKKAMNQDKNTPYNIDKILSSLSGLQVGFGSASSNLSEQLIAEASTLEDLQVSVSQEKEQLQELHELEEIEDNTLDTLIGSYEESTKTFTDEFEERQETLIQQLQHLQTSWQKEQEIHQREVKERNETYQKTQQRSLEEYRYNLDLARNLSNEEYEQRKKELYKELEEIKKEHEKAIKEREEEISQRELECLEAKNKVEVHEQELEKNKQEGKEKGQHIGHYNAKVAADLRTKEIEGERRNYQLQIEALDRTIETQNGRIEKLSQQLDAALKQVQDLAVKAIEGTSNRNAFDAIKEITNELAKNQQKSK
ncbi:hypothetical protein [Spirulina sp. 06S082]|uniref:hypothetical protein n=1 Tax=Spirulina sp. 06S082 TaxID=3110248 RepID=UPI002B21CB55|nr:hypothetical protein [Spirulina sp. 06S082]MEA5468824.1 hypothetical protein [Spirulina sp. 06S082]